MKTKKYILRNTKTGLYVRTLRLAGGLMHNLTYTEPVGDDGIIDHKNGMGDRAAQAYWNYAEVAMHRDAINSQGGDVEIV